MGTKAKMNNRRSRIIIAVCLSLALLAAIGATTFAWIRNYVGVEKMSITTGQMKYSITLYQKDGGAYKATPLFDTDDPNMPVDSDTLETFLKKSQINVQPGEEVFFVIQKHEGSIDLDVSLGFEKDGDEKQYEYMGQTLFKMQDASTSFDQNLVKDNVDNAITALSATANSATQKNMNIIWNTVQKTRSLDDSADYACIRLAFVQDPANQTNDVTDRTFPLNLKFCVSQKGAPAPENDNSGARVDVTDINDLSKALESYGFNDEIYITGVGTEAKPVVFNGDMVFTRPCKVILNRSYIKVNGNLIFSYAYDAEYVLDTISDGHLDVSGNFQIDLPNAGITLSGANNTADGKADVYVAGDFTANASRLETRGLNFKGLRVCNPDESLKAMQINGATRLTTTKRTQLGAISVANDHAFGLVIQNEGSIEKLDLTKLIQDGNLKMTPCIWIDNAGTLVDPTIRLPYWSVRFVCDDKDTEDARDDVYSGNTRIKANKGAGVMKAITSTFIAEDGTVNWPEDSSKLTAAFFSNIYELVNGESPYGDRDDFEYDERTEFIEILERDSDGNATSIKIHYEQPSEKVVRQPQYAELEALVPSAGEVVPLSKYLEFYGYLDGDNNSSNDLVNLLKEVEIVCYGDKVLSSSDYATIRKMQNLESLDLSEAISEKIEVKYRDAVLKKEVTEYHNTVPDGAFLGMSYLNKVIMSESDTAWGRNIFKDTSVEEITFPQSLLRLLNTQHSETSTGISFYGTFIAQDVLTNIKYVYTSITNVAGVWADHESTQYFFTPDKASYEYYKGLCSSNLMTDQRWQSKIFMNNGVVRYENDENIFLRYDPNADPSNPEECIAEFVVQTNGTGAWYTNLNAGNTDPDNPTFDFSQIKINGVTYKIVSYDPYALYGKLTSESEALLNIKFSESLEKIGRYAFAANSRISTVDFLENANTAFEGCAFYNNSALKKVAAVDVTALNGGYNFARNSALETFDMPKLTEVNGAYDLGACTALERVDISVIRLSENGENKNFYAKPSGTSTNYDSYSYAKFYIHTENALPKSEYEGKTLVAADYRYIFVDSEYAPLYKATDTYTGVADVGNVDIDEIKTATIDGVEYYYCPLNDTEARLVACLSSSIDKANETEYTLVSSITDSSTGKTYTITKIGSAAYHFTAIKARVLNIPSGVKEIEDHAFDSSKGPHKKNIITFNLVNVVKAGEKAFYYVDMVRLNGDVLAEVGTDTLTNNASLIVANLPSLSRSQPADMTGDAPKVFIGASSLRIAHISYSDDIRYDNSLSRTKGYIRFVNYTTEANSLVLSDVNTVVAGIEAKPKNESNSDLRSFVNTDLSYSNIYYSDFYDCKFFFNGIEESISIPGYFYYRPDENKSELTLFAVSPDVSGYAFGDWEGNDYTTPSTVEAKSGTGALETHDVTVIGSYAYGFVKFSLGGDFIVGDATKTLSDYAFRDYTSITGNASVLNNVGCLDLNNVESVGTLSCSRAKMTELKAPQLMYMANQAFSYCDKFSILDLPSYIEATGFSSFEGCYKLEEVTLGINAKNMTGFMFLQASELKSITILNTESVVSVGGGITGKTDITVNIYNGLLSAYTEKYGTSFGGIPLTNFTTFGNATTVDGVLYCWNVLNESQKTAYIDSISGTLPSTLSIPAEIGEYKIVAVTATAMSSLTNVKKVVLPDEMESLAFTTANLSANVEELEISADNAFFKTVNGVLYSKDGKTLYVYPRAKSDTAFEITAGVAEISDEAFYGVEKLETLTIKGSVTIGNRAFAGASLLGTIDFDSATASTFAGRDVFSGANVNLKIAIPTGSLNNYKANVLVDYSILDKFVEQ